MNNSNPVRLAVFDIDGTIAHSDKFSPSILEAFSHLQRNGYITTVSTGRGYVRAKEALGKYFEQIVSPSASLILEHGTKITHRDGSVLFAEYLGVEEIEHIIDFARANIDLFRVMIFNPIDLKHKVQIWCIDERDLEAETAKRGHYGEVFYCSIGEARERLLAQKLSNVTFKLKGHVQVHNLKLGLTKTPMNLLFLDGNMEFVKSNTNKALAIDYLLRDHKIDASRLLVAGNAINDVDMLNMAAAKRILVGEGSERDVVKAYLYNYSEVVNVPSPEALGVYLQTLS